MRRSARLVLGSWLACAAWLGCNAILGNESAVFAPEVDGSAADGRLDPPDTSSPAVDTGTPPDAGQDGPACVDTSTDPSNCGGCGHGCLGGSCVAGACQAVAIAQVRGRPAAIAVDATHVYWTNITTGSVMRAPIGGGAVQTIHAGADGTSSGFGIAVVGGYVYFTLDAEDHVVRCPVAGCAGPPEIVVAGGVAPSFVDVLDGGQLVFTEGLVGGRIGRCTLPCDGGASYIDSGEFPLRATVAGDAIVWSTLFNGGRIFVHADGGTSLLLANTQAYDVRVAGQEVFAASLSGGPRAVFLDGGGARSVGPTGLAAYQGEYLALDGLDVVFANENADAVMRCARTGCDDSGTTLGKSTPFEPKGVAVNATQVFWAESDFNDGGTIKRIAK
jgi:hypothetical protein